MRLRSKTTAGLVAATTDGRCNSSTSSTANTESCISAPATPRVRFDPDADVTTVPTIRTCETSSFVVDVFPFVPDTKITTLDCERSSIALGQSARSTRPGRVSPDPRPSAFESAPAVFAIDIARFRRGLFTPKVYLERRNFLGVMRK